MIIEGISAVAKLLPRHRQCTISGHFVCTATRCNTSVLLYFLHFLLHLPNQGCVLFLAGRVAGSEVSSILVACFLHG